MNKKTKLKLNVPYKTVDGHILTLLAKGSFKNYAGEFMYTYSIESKKLPRELTTSCIPTTKILLTTNF